MSIADAKAALDGGSVDVALIAGATAYQAKQQGYHMVADGEGLIKAIIAVAVREDFYEKNQDVISRFMEAQDKIAAFMKENQEENPENRGRGTGPGRGSGTGNVWIL